MFYISDKAMGTSKPSMQSPRRKTDLSWRCKVVRPAVDIHMVSQDGAGNVQILYLFNVFMVLQTFPDPCQSSRLFKGP